MQKTFKVNYYKILNFIKKISNKIKLYTLTQIFINLDSDIINSDIRTKYIKKINDKYQILGIY